MMDLFTLFLKTLQNVFRQVSLPLKKDVMFTNENEL